MQRFLCEVIIFPLSFIWSLLVVLICMWCCCVFVYRDMFGAVTQPLKMTRTVVTGQSYTLVCRLLYLLTYFIRSASVSLFHLLWGRNLTLWIWLMNKSGQKKVVAKKKNIDSATKDSSSQDALALKPLTTKISFVLKVPSLGTLWSQ